MPPFESIDPKRSRYLRGLCSVLKNAVMVSMDPRNVIFELEPPVEIKTPAILRRPPLRSLPSTCLLAHNAWHRSIIVLGLLNIPLKATGDVTANISAFSNFGYNAFISSLIAHLPVLKHLLQEAQCLIFRLRRAIFSVLPPAPFAHRRNSSSNISVLPPFRELPAIANIYFFLFIVPLLYIYSPLRST